MKSSMIFNDYQISKCLKIIDVSVLLSMNEITRKQTEKVIGNYPCFNQSNLVKTQYYITLIIEL